MGRGLGVVRGGEEDCKTESFPVDLFSFLVNKIL